MKFVSQTDDASAHQLSTWHGTLRFGMQLMQRCEASRVVKYKTKAFLSNGGGGGGEGAE